MISFDFSLRRDDFELQACGKLDQQTTGLVGASGCGKTTLLHALAGLVRPTKGWIRLDEAPLVDAETGHWTPPHQRSLGVVFQDARLFPHLDVGENLRYALPELPSRRKFAVEPIVELLELGPLLRRRTQGLSGGERQRVALGRALLASPRALLLDEPLGALDTTRKQQMLSLLARVRDELDIPMLYVTHDLSELLQLTQELIVMDRGRIALAGAYHDIALSLLDRGIGHEVTNVFEAHAVEGEGSSVVLAAGTESKMMRLRASSRQYASGDRVLVLIRPEDIALSRSEVQGTSIQNQLRGIVSKVVSNEDRVVVVVDVGIPLLTEVSESGLRQLGLREGDSVWTLLKSRAIKILSVRKPSAC